jgi:hypothetical protein
VIAEVFNKTTFQIPKHMIQTCNDRLRRYDELA